MAHPLCPTCKKPVEPYQNNPLFPFCSERCKLVDLGNWLEDRYRVTLEVPFSEGDDGVPDTDEQKP
ncbi:MAG: DNA gyrase inhibitor YacG [Deltaproteobacteria bacterium]|nr:DNA gyrase inhibitor YacG [Deltaproteobacteria bacterium]